MQLVIRKEHVEKAAKRYAKGQRITCCCPTAIALNEQCGGNWYVFYNGCTKQPSARAHPEAVKFRLSPLLREQVSAFTCAGRTFEPGTYELIENPSYVDAELP